MKPSHEIHETIPCFHKISRESESNREYNQNNTGGGREQIDPSPKAESINS